MRLQLRIFERLPERLAACNARSLARYLGGPALLYLSGRREPPLLVSVLLHGNETSGWEGLRRVLQQAVDLPRSLIVFIGNVHAAAAGVRTLHHQQDFNRIWRGAAGPEGDLASDVLAALSGVDLFAAVDLHNNTGRNPHYAVLTHITGANLGLAYLFADKAVYVREPDTVMTRAFAEHCPAVTLELGPIGDPRCIDRAFDFLARCLRLTEIPPAEETRLALFRSEARVHVAEGVPFAFADQATDRPLVLTGGLEAVNFHELPIGTEFAVTTSGLGALEVLDVLHRDVTRDYFALTDGKILLKRPVIPAMYTTDPVVVRQDCLCYFMQHMARDPLTPGEGSDHPPPS